MPLWLRMPTQPVEDFIMERHAFSPVREKARLARRFSLPQQQQQPQKLPQQQRAPNVPPHPHRVHIRADMPASPRHARSRPQPQHQHPHPHRPHEAAFHPQEQRGRARDRHPQRGSSQAREVSRVRARVVVAEGRDQAPRGRGRDRGRSRDRAHKDDKDIKVCVAIHHHSPDHSPDHPPKRQNGRDRRGVSPARARSISRGRAERRIPANKQQQQKQQKALPLSEPEGRHDMPGVRLVRPPRPRVVVRRRSRSQSQVRFAL